MSSIILSGLLLGVLVVFYLVRRSQQAEIGRLERSVDEVQREERRVFEFMHGLGVAFSDGLGERDVRRLIVEGAVRILEAHGGAIYLTQRGGEVLIPSYLSQGCPPLVLVPKHILEQAATTPVAVESFLRLHGVGRGEGLLGEVWERNEPLLLSSAQGDPRPGQLHDTALQTGSVMAAPLSFAKQALGVLAVANGPMGRAFTPADLDVFKAIAGQSAFALYNMLVYSEAGEKRRLDRDLQTAREIQSILLPAAPPEVPGFEVHGTMLPARQVSGDYYDFVRVDDDRLGIAIADVSGKGVAASLIMAICRGALRMHAVGNPSPSAVLREVNRQLYPDVREDMFISMAYVVLNHRDGTIVLSRAGHDAPLLYAEADRGVTRLNPRGMAIGIDSGDVFDRVSSDFSVNLGSRDCLVLYTDGMTEAVDEKGLEFGLSRVKQSVQTSAGLGARAIVDQLAEELRSFVGRQPQHDDVTLIAIRKT